MSFEIFNNLEKMPAINGKCEKNTLFTPDNKYCYECNNIYIGIPGCKGACNFSLKRNNNIICEGKCDIGYIESSEGICELCNNINKGCYECHYENNYPNNYYGIKRKRRFVCEICENDYIQIDGKCYHCSDFQKNCEKCEVNVNNEFICNKCEFGYYLNKHGNCHYCNDLDQFISGNDQCIRCNDIDNGGIKGCKYCEINKDKAICRLCGENYILLTNNNTCLKRLDNKELNNFDKCEELNLDNNNKLYCSRCKEDFSLLKEKNETKCCYIPTVYDGFKNDNYYDYDYPYYYDNSLKNDINYFYVHYYYNFIYKDIQPCQKTINIGSKEIPLYTCIECYNLFTFNKIYKNDNILITNKNNNLSYCLRIKEPVLKNCTNAFKISYRSKIIYSCFECAKDNLLIYNG